MIDLQVQIPDGHQVEIEAGHPSLLFQVQDCLFDNVYTLDATGLEPGDAADVRCFGCGQLAALTVEEVSP